MSTPPPYPDRATVIASGIKILAAWCLRLMIIVAATYLVGIVLWQTWRGVLPIALALIVCTVLYPPFVVLRKLGVHPGLAAFLTIVGSFTVIGVLLRIMAPQVGRQSQTLYYQAFEGIQRLQLWLQGPPFNLDAEDLSALINRAVNWLQEGGLLFSGLGFASSALITIGIIVVLTFFFLKDGDLFLPWLSGIVGPRIGLHLTEVLHRCWATLGGFIRAQAIVSLVDAVFIGLGLAILGVPMALALAVLTFVAGFIPIVGAFVAGALSVLVALVSLGFTEALIALAIVLVVQQVESNILAPLLHSRAMNLHPVVVLVSITIGGSQFGMMGAFLAVPVAAMVAVLMRYLNEKIAQRTGEYVAPQQDSAGSNPAVDDFGDSENIARYICSYVSLAPKKVADIFSR
ncbi:MULTISPECIES: AI-2E family transporter [unclassified Corynebacterium]|uniref:AI-2E family transporter n=1 Tax=unclassified Corynebacterium TaxID=2624378 RepID=UPI002167E413|nr:MULTISPECIES: AI-2E family transporter [unclassified Corynebacterium]MCS4489923.1 AI-2E family transporter [Corynebacterium sp. ES2775-CONJ]MCS4531819.1 AI-2E family transporter [Corynebacterium sp. ES2730-CONJ]